MITFVHSKQLNSSRVLLKGIAIRRRVEKCITNPVKISCLNCAPVSIGTHVFVKCYYFKQNIVVCFVCVAKMLEVLCLTSVYSNMLACVFCTLSLFYCFARRNFLILT